MATIKQLVALALNLPLDTEQKSVVVKRTPTQADGEISHDPVKSKITQSSIDKPADIDLSLIRKKLASDDIKTQEEGLAVLRSNLVNMTQSTRGKVVNLLIQSLNSKQCKLQSDVIGVLNELLPKVSSTVRAEALSNLANAIGKPILDPTTQVKTMALIKRNFPASQTDVTVRFFNSLVVRDLARAVGDSKVSPNVVESSIDFVGLHIDKTCTEDERKIVMGNLREILDAPTYSEHLLQPSKKKLEYFLKGEQSNEV